MTDGERRGLTRRDALRAGVTVGAAGVTAGVVGMPSAGAMPPHQRGGKSWPGGDLIVHNGRVHTMDRAGTTAEVVAVRDGTIVYVGGSVGRALRHFAQRPRMINAHRRVVLPGIVDVHNHMVLLGNRPGRHTPLENAYSIADVQRIYRMRARRVPRGEFITTIGGFHPNQFAEHRLPTRAELDEALPHHPAYISIGFVGPSVTNSLGKQFFENVPKPYGPVPVGADGSIAASGFTTAGPTGQATLALRQMLTFAARKRGVRDAMSYAAAIGLTTSLDQGAFQATDTPVDGSASENNYTMHLPFLAVYNQGERRDAAGRQEGIVRLRINFLMWDKDVSIPIARARVQNAFPFFGGDLVRTGAAGEFLADPFTLYAGGNPVWHAAAVEVAKAGWRAEVHSLTKTDFQTEIQGYEAVNAEVGISDLHWVVAHVPYITEDYVNRLKAVGGGVNLTGYQYLDGTGPDAGPPYRMLLDNGIPVGMSSDGAQIAPMNPWIHAYYATTGRNALGQQINVGQQVGREEFLTHYTRSTGWFLGGEDTDRLGTIEPGRLGDLLILDRDYFTVPVEQLRLVRSALTVLGGVVVHDMRDNTGYW